MVRNLKNAPKYSSQSATDRPPYWQQDHSFLTFRMRSNHETSFLRHSLSTNQPFLSPVARQLTLVPRCLLIDRTKTLATQATYSCSTRDNACACSYYFKNSATSATSEDNEERNSVNKSRAEFSLKLTIKNLLWLRGQVNGYCLSNPDGNTQMRTKKTTVKTYP